MKTKFILILVIFTVKNLNVKSQIALETNAIIEPYIGGPNFAKTFTSPSYFYANTTINQTHSAPLMGLKAEVFVGDRIGIGANIFYNTLTINYTNSYYSTNEFQEAKIETITRRMDRLRIIAYFNYHFNLNSPDIDLYWGLGAGYNTKRISYTKNNVKYIDIEDSSKPLIIFPVTSRTYIGFRYFPIPNIGINAEFGIGGPLVSAGVSFRILEY